MQARFASRAKLAHLFAKASSSWLTPMKQGEAKPLLEPKAAPM